MHQPVLGPSKETVETRKIYDFRPNNTRRMSRVKQREGVKFDKSTHREHYNSTPLNAGA